VLLPILLKMQFNIISVPAEEDADADADADADGLGQG
jgi:hypothetical protein